MSVRTQLDQQRAALHRLLEALGSAASAAAARRWDGCLPGLPDGTVVHLDVLREGYNPFYETTRELEWTPSIGRWRWVPVRQAW